MDDYFDYIDDFMAGKLSSDAQMNFEEELNRNSSLKEAVSNYNDAKKLSEGLLELDMMETLNKLQQEGNVRYKPKTNLRRKWVLLTALLASLLFAGWWYMNSKEMALDKKQILASYERPIDADATKSIDTIGMDSFSKGKYYFALNRFEDSEQWLKKHLSKEINKNSLSMGYYWLGAAHIEQWEVAEAMKAWEKSDEQAAIKNLELLE